MCSLGSRVRRWIVVALRVCALLVVAGCIAGALYQWHGLRADRAAFPPPGRMVNIGTHRMHLWCRGTGAPVVMLDAGGGGWSTHWQPIQDELSRHTTACAFDRSGMGWSEAGPGALDGVSAARELHTLVEKAGLARPFVYVGHSLGANFGEVYYGAYPEDLSGLVLIDPGMPTDMMEDFHGDRAAALALTGCGWKCAGVRLATWLGVTRLAMHIVPASKLMSPTMRAQYRFGLAGPSTAATTIGYLELVPKTAYQELAVDNYHDLRLTILSSDKTRHPEGKETEHDVEVWHAGVLQTLSKLAASSTHGRGPIVLPGSTHGSIVLAPEYAHTVSTEIERMVDEVRSTGRNP